jgi:choline dehydrogenase
MVAGVRRGRRMLVSPAFDRYPKEEIHPGLDKQSNEEIAQACRDKLGIVYHPVGTCKMAKTIWPVVDPQLRVRGMQSLRVVDASIMQAVHLRLPQPQPQPCAVEPAAGTRSVGATSR